MATYSSILAWEIPQAEELGGGSMDHGGSQRIGYDLATKPPPLKPSLALGPHKRKC